VTVREWFRAIRGERWKQTQFPITMYFATGDSSQPFTPAVTVFDEKDLWDFCVDDRVTAVMFEDALQRCRRRHVTFQDLLFGVSK
jgi:hypothetical protein